MTPFEFHTGFDIKAKKAGDGETVYEMDCPFCGKTGKFHFFEDTRWGCKVCGLKGNRSTFISLLYEKLCIADIATLASRKSLPQRALEGVKLNRLNATYVIPTYNPKGAMNNLYKYVEYNNTIYGTPGIEATLYDWKEVTNDTIWLCEGQWDKMAAVAILGDSRPVTPIGLPGANMMSLRFAGAFADKDVVLIFDHDDAGEKGIQKSLDVFKESPQKPKSIKVVKWPEDKAEGYDLRDFYKENGRRSYALIQALIEEVDDKEVVKVTTENVIANYDCDSYDKALDYFEQAYHTTSDMRAALAATMASIYSLNIESPEQVWLKIIGAPGCGKTRIAKAVSASDYVISQSTFTGLFSGWKSDDDSDAGMIPRISGRTLIVKDADPLVKQKDAERIFSELRDFYDKDSSVTYRNKQSFDYRNIKSTFIICGTQVLRRVDQSFLGERFLSIEMDVSPSDQEAISQKMLDRSLMMACGTIEDPENDIMSAMKGWLDHLRDRKLDSTIPKEFQQLLIRLCSLTALMRTSVDRGFQRRLESPAVPELPTRLIGQTAKLTLALCAVFGVNKADNQVFEIVQKVIRDTINPRSHRFKICDVILEQPGIAATDLLDITGLDPNTLKNELEDLTELGFVHKTKITSSTGPGRKRWGWHLDNKIVSPLKELV